LTKKQSAHDYSHDLATSSNQTDGSTRSPSNKIAPGEILDERAIYMKSV
jgi:hypothetical protein